MELGLANGILVKEGKVKIALDPACNFKKQIDLAVFSHAHADHVRSISDFPNIVATKETVKLAEVRYGVALSGVRYLKYGSNYSIAGISLSLHSAGHVLGSAQIRVQGREKSMLYTGDLKPRIGLTTDKANPIESDILIIESTYGSPEYNFPPRDQVYQQIVDWVDQRFSKGIDVLIGGYVLGKAQELTKMFNQHGIVPLVHPKIYKINKVYEEFGVKLGKYVNSESERGTELMSGDFVCIVPVSNIKTRILNGLRNLSGAAHISTAVATGWAVSPVVKYRYGCEYAFPLSDHADFEELIMFVKQVNPKLVYTTHGFANRLAKEIRRRLKIRAEAIGLFEQRKLFEFV